MSLGHVAGALGSGRKASKRTKNAYVYVRRPAQFIDAPPLFSFEIIPRLASKLAKSPSTLTFLFFLEIENDKTYLAIVATESKLLFNFFFFEIDGCVS